MQTPVQITFRHMPPSDAVRTRVLELVHRLERFHDRIIGCSVVIEAPPGQQRNGAPFDIKLALTVPGHDVHAQSDHCAHESHEDVYVALRDAFEKAKRQLREFPSPRSRTTLGREE